MIHRALFGSIERFFGVLIEHYAGAFPLWLAPVQVAYFRSPIGSMNTLIRSRRNLSAAGFRVEANTKSDKIGAKIRDAQLQKVPYMLVLGDKEVGRQYSCGSRTETGRHRRDVSGRVQREDR
jgi:threonyl-tRNA synthetase